MPPGADQMWPGVGVPCVRVARSSGRGRTRSSGRRNHLVRQFTKLRPGGNVGEIGDARSGLSNTGSSPSKG
ncbi:Os04g0133501 [Oryza sativa Japonica Group]|uniref:Os04g0133501 protein n=2 Tax=Oryza sativa subsp. japonica TaxID=39947 RepID=B9FDG9_ORYSJ|nr:hypothetical protein OsJ_13646 [Oryza sativa Japonica Group]BAS87725.1 Os04g0133501 [Oryza sativa Japonica Group]